MLYRTCRPVILLNSAYRNAAKRKEILELHSNLTETEMKFIRPIVRKWRSKSLFSILMTYRAKRIQDFFNLSQQVRVNNLKQL